MPDVLAAATWSRLKAFLAVYDGGSVRAAAETLHVTAPAVSAAVGALEEGLGTRLFAKSGRGITPTEAGDTFATYARSLLGLLGEAVRSVGDAESGRLRIGAVSTVSEYVLPALLAGFMSRFPRVDLSVSVLPRDELFARAHDHAFDVVLAGRPPRGSGLRTLARRRHRLLVVGMDAEVDVTTARWLLTAEGSGTRFTTVSLLAALEATPPTLTLGTQGATIAAARAGLGVTLAHEEAVAASLESGELVAVDVPGTPLERPWHLCSSESPTAVARLFLAHLTDPAEVGAQAFHTRNRPQG